MNVLPIIVATLPVVERLMDYIGKLRAVGRQSGELTPEEDAALDARIAALGKTESKPDHWKTDGELASQSAKPN